MFIFERKIDNVSRGGAERDTHRIWNRLQAPRCQQRARCEARTHEPRDRDVSRSRTLNRLSHPGAPALGSYISCPRPLLQGEQDVKKDSEFWTIYAASSPVGIELTLEVVQLRAVQWNFLQQWKCPMCDIQYNNQMWLQSIWYVVSVGQASDSISAQIMISMEPVWNSLSLSFSLSLPSLCTCSTSQNK